jgi:hypothetical protein
MLVWGRLLARRGLAARRLLQSLVNFFWGLVLLSSCVGLGVFLLKWHPFLLLLPPRGAGAQRFGTAGCNFHTAMALS